ncbi:MAG: DUF4845 domain-containing protein [Gammaproteobacteria bacterium]|nr:DUF4845 domain-containing protein [Gammaproteobacteria bacterium]MDH5801035.1 DUF4845 domain-containing protein [Gammaproteobacteria bacterium]
MRNIKTQMGLTAISMAFLLVVGGFAVLVALRLIPVYLEDFNVKSHVAKLNANPGLAEMTDEEILSTLSKRLGVDNVKNVNLDEHVEIVRDGATTTVVVNYEVRRPLLGNVDAVVRFTTDEDAKVDGKESQ